MRITILLCSLMCWIHPLHAQNTFRQNTFYIESFGNSISILSLNFEKQFQARPGLGFRAGLGYHTDEKFPLSIPLGFNYLIHIRDYRSFIDLGAGATISNASELKTHQQELLTGPGAGEIIASYIPSLGYRQHLLSDMLMWRVAFSAVVNKYRSFPFIGLSAGLRL